MKLFLVLRKIVRGKHRQVPQLTVYIDILSRVPNTRDENNHSWALDGSASDCWLFKLPLNEHRSIQTSCMWPHMTRYHGHHSTYEKQEVAKRSTKKLVFFLFY